MLALVHARFLAPLFRALPPSASARPDPRRSRLGCAGQGAGAHTACAAGYDRHLAVDMTGVAHGHCFR